MLRGLFIVHVLHRLWVILLIYSPMNDSILSEREREVFDLFGEGLNIKRIAERLSISPRTCEAHRNSLKSKLGVQKSHDLVVMAVQERFKADIKSQGLGIELAISTYLDGCGDDDNETKAKNIRGIVESHYS